MPANIVTATATVWVFNKHFKSIVIYWQQSSSYISKQTTSILFSQKENTTKKRSKSLLTNVL